MKVKYILKIVLMLIILIAQSGCSSSAEDFQLSAQQAIEYTLEDGQLFLDDNFTDWKTWTEQSAVSQTVSLKLLLDDEYEKTFNIWVVTLEQEEEGRTVNFIVDDATGAVLGGWDSSDIDIDRKLDAASECTSSDAVINAILYYSVRAELIGHLYPYKHIHVTADDWPGRDNVLLEDINLYMNANEDLLPNGKAVWRVTLCEHTKRHNVFEFDTQIIIGREDGVVYGFYPLGP